MSVQPVEAFDPYSTATAMFAALPTWVNEYDARRITAYQVYEQMYWSVPETFKLVLRGEENNPIYIPTSKVIVDTTNRFLCPKPGFVVDGGAPDEQLEVATAFKNLFKRERFWSKFTANKRFGLIRGDWCWHVIGNLNKPEGSRIKIETIDPGSYFPVPHPSDPDRIIAVHIIDQYTNEDGDLIIKRQTYTKGANPVENDGSDTTIYNSISTFSVEDWERLDSKAIEVLKEPTPLPPEIKAIPVYHVPNNQSPGDPYGSSELRGVERIMAAVNQSISDEEMILALDGLGMYETDGGPPRDAQNRVTDWILGPGRVVEHPPGTTFSRVTGVSSVQPMQDHLAFLIKAIKEASATPDIAVGAVDVSVAESGVARLLQFAPLLSKVEEREEVVTDVHEQMFYDLCTGWLPAYEGVTDASVAHPVWGSGLPDDRDAQFKEIMSIFDGGLADADWARAELAKLGYEFPKDTGQKVLNEAQARAKATDPFATRMGTEEDDEA